MALYQSCWVGFGGIVSRLCGRYCYFSTLYPLSPILNQSLTGHWTWCHFVCISHKFSTWSQTIFFLSSIQPVLTLLDEGSYVISVCIIPVFSSRDKQSLWSRWTCSMEWATLKELSWNLRVNGGCQGNICLPKVHLATISLWRWLTVILPLFQSSTNPPPSLTQYSNPLPNNHHPSVPISWTIFKGVGIFKNTFL
jgi:hypothetical protein